MRLSRIEQERILVDQAAGVALERRTNGMTLDQAVGCSRQRVVGGGAARRPQHCDATLIRRESAPYAPGSTAEPRW